jgi:hypothetical protein
LQVAQALDLCLPKSFCVLRHLELELGIRPSVVLRLLPGEHLRLLLLQLPALPHFDHLRIGRRRLLRLRLRHAQVRVRARVESIEAKTFQMKDGRTSRALNVKYAIDEQFLPEEFQGGKDVFKYDTIWLDYDSQGRLASGTNMNLGLGRFRHATGTNSPMTLKQIVESAFQRTVELEISLEPDRKDPTQMRNNIKGVFPVTE